MRKVAFGMKIVSKEQEQIQQTAMLAGVVGQIGCLTLILIGAALGTGILLDRFLETRPLFTVLFLVGSVPVNLFLTIRVGLSAVARAQRNTATNKSAEDSTNE
jgi:F0F1-type ATP synthase assembly protein I